jgi:hypothetical protein
MLTDGFFRQLSLRLRRQELFSCLQRHCNIFRTRRLQGQLTFVKHLLGREEEETQSTPHVLETWVVLCMVLREL